MHKPVGLLAAENCGLRKLHTKAFKTQMLGAGLNNAIKDAFYYKNS